MLKRISFANMRRKMMEIMDMNAKTQLTDDVIMNVVFMEDEGL